MSDENTSRPKYGWFVEWTTKISKVFEHNPGTFLGIAMSALLLSGCANSSLTGKAIDPVTGKKATAEEIAHSGDQAIKGLNKEIGDLLAQRAVIENKILVLNEEAEEILAASDEAIERANQDTLKRKEMATALWDIVKGFVPQASVVSPIAALLIGSGALYDRRRSAKVISGLKDEVKTLKNGS